MKSRALGVVAKSSVRVAVASIVISLVVGMSRPSSGQVILNEIMAANYSAFERPYHKHHDWIELFNPSTSPVALRGYGLSDRENDPYKWVFTNEVLAPGRYLVVLASGNEERPEQASFRLSAGGESVFLTDPSGTSIDQVTYGRLAADQSWGRDPTTGDWGLYVVSTAERPNEGDRFPTLAKTPRIDPESGFYPAAVTVRIEASTTENDRIILRYTLDGSEPSGASAIYTEPLVFESTRVLRARAFSNGLHPSATVTRSYFIGEQSDLATVALAIDPIHLYDFERGIFAFGPNADPDPPHFGANFYHNWERPVSILLLEGSGRVAFELDGGVRIHGAISRALEQKSLRLYTRGGYGMDRFDCRVFPDKEIDKFRRLVLRNTGADWLRGQIRDGLQHRIAKGLDMETAAVRPVRVFLNGDYWGLYNVRERVDVYYLEANTGIESDDIDLVKNGEADAGSSESYEDLLAYLRTHGAEGIHYDHVARQMDLENFATYYAYRAFNANRDWPRNNHVHWKAEDGKWRWILHDTEWGVGLVGAVADRETLRFLLHPDDPESRNPEESTFLFRTLLTQAHFQQLFVNRCADLLNTTCRPDRTLPILEAMVEEVAEEMPRHFSRWDGDVADWEIHLADIRRFLENRPARFREHVREQFQLSGDMQIDIHVLDARGGVVRVAGIAVEDEWSGTYYLDVPVSLLAVAAPGYTFAGWSGSVTSEKPRIEVSAMERAELSASFVAQGVSTTYRESRWIRAEPNPTFGATEIRFELGDVEHGEKELREYRVDLFDMSGRHLREWDFKPGTLGPQAITWNGRDDLGRVLPSGVYGLRATNGKDRVSGRLIALR